MKKFLVLVLSLGVLSLMAFSWGSATHVYIYEQLIKLDAIPNTNAIFGVIAPDVFNYMFTEPELAAYLYDQTHHNFIAVWAEQKNEKDRSLGYGFVAHNDTWGIDFTAHHQAQGLSGSEGYVIAKAEILYGYIGEMLAGYGLDPATGLEICHELIESAIDLMIKRVDPDVPAKLIAAASHADKNFLNLLYRAYGPGLGLTVGLNEAGIKTIIAQNDAGFRYAVTALGNALKKKYPQDVNAVAEQLSMAAQAAFGITVDAGQIAEILMLAMSICPDYLYELTATVGFVGQQLLIYNIVR
ncbi:MAG: hypothetical protein MUP52_09085 [Candidatus Aminicenantes bacterium]|nr:hypothetical protein [Candidatus Aminicenantes bacterium]